MCETPNPEPSHGLSGDGELLMRRMLYKNKQYDPRVMPPILAATFEPRKTDGDGLSLSRRQSKAFPNFLTAEQMKAACGVRSERDRRECGVCAVVAGSVRGIGLTVVSSPTPTDSGHVHLEEIKYKDFEGVEMTDESFRRIALWVSKLVQLACENILIVPGPTPAAGNSPA